MSNAETTFSSSLSSSESLRKHRRSAMFARDRRLPYVLTLLERPIPLYLFYEISVLVAYVI